MSGAGDRTVDLEERLVCCRVCDGERGREALAESAAKGLFTLHVTFPFRRGTSPFSKFFSWVFKRICSH